jgi:hypothetical protein
MYGKQKKLGGEFYIWLSPQFTTQKPLDNEGSIMAEMLQLDAFK